MRSRSFGVSTHLYHDRRLSRDHLLEIAAHGFDCTDVFATRTHFDYHNQTTIADLQQWLGEAGLALHAVHAPVGDSFAAGRWVGRLTLASPDQAERQRALEEAERALYVARRIPYEVLIVHVGLPEPGRGSRPEAGTPQVNSRDAARRSIDALREIARPLNVAVAVEILPNALSRAPSLVHFVEDVVEAGVGICLDCGHAHLDGDLVDIVETVSEHLLAVEVHDNLRRGDEHLVPFDGSIEWPAVLTALQKVGYDSGLVFEISRRGSTKEMLRKARAARERMGRFLER